MPRRATTTTDTRPEPTANPFYGPGSEPAPTDASGEYIAALVAQGGNPFSGNALSYLNDIARGQTGGPYNVRDERIPVYPHVPSGEEAKALCERVALPLETLRRSLTLSPFDFNRWLAGEAHVVDEMFDEKDIRTLGVRRVFGVIDAYVKATAG